MRVRFIIFALVLGLLSPTLQALGGGVKQGLFIEAMLCASGDIVRIALGEPKEQDTPEQHHACHAICSRDEDCDGRSKTE